MEQTVNPDLKEVLRKTLDDLDERAFKSFRRDLRDQKKIPWSQLEKADICDTVDLMVQVYTSEAGGVMVSILRKMGQNQLAHDLEKNLISDQESQHLARRGRGKGEGINLEAEMERIDLAQSEGAVVAPQQERGTKASLKQKLKEHLTDKFSIVHQNSGVDRMQDIYTDINIVEGCTGGIESRHEVSTISMRQVQTRSKGRKIKLKKMFAEKSVTKVLTLGIAGVGKTVAMQKFAIDWAGGKIHHSIDFVFVLLFQEMNLQEGKRFSLIDLIIKFYPKLTDLKNKEIIFEFSEWKILFVFDGLDESRFQLNFSECITDLEEVSSVDKLISSVIAGQLLPSALIWVTTRPAASSQIPRHYFNLVTEVRGFSNDEKIKFFRNNIEGKEKAERVIHHVKDNISLHIMCYLPMFCHIIASMADEILKVNSNEGPPKTLTEYYTLYSASQLTRMTEKYTEKNGMSSRNRGTFLLKLGELAYSHLMEGKFIFYEKDLEKCGIDVTSGALQSGVCTELFKSEHSVAGDRIFSFVHLSVQEFLAALYFLSEGFHWLSDPFLTTQEERIKYALLPSSRFDLCKFAVEKSLQSQNGHLDLFIRFLVGLVPMIEPEVKSPLNVVLPQLAGRQQSIKHITQFVKQKISENISPERTINLFHCLHELGDTSLLKEIKRYRHSAEENKVLSPTQCSALVHLMLMSAEELDEFDLKRYMRSEEGLNKMLPVVKISKTVWLDRCDLSPSSCEILAKALHESPSHLRELDMSDNDLLDEGVKQLCLELKERKHKLQTWRLKQCHLSKASCEMMVLLLQRTSSSLRELDMSNNDLQDGGVKLLSEGLRQPHCKLERLRLSFCGISYRGCAFLSSALISNPSYLKLLDVSYNHPGDSGVRDLMDRLNDPNCQLETLRHDHGGEYRINPGPRKYACELTMDPNTANRLLYLSEGDRQVSTVTVEYQYDDHPSRFDWYPQVLCKESLSGHCYWEAEWCSDYGAIIAVAYESIQRKQGNHESNFGLNDKSWSLRCDATSYCACHNGEGTDIPAPSPRSSRVGVYLDWKAGTLSFYSVSSDTLTHLHTFHTTFTQPLYPGFGLPYTNSSVTLCQIT